MSDKGRPDTRTPHVFRHEGKDYVSMDEYLRLNQRYRDFYTPRWIPVSERLPDMKDDDGCDADVLGYFPEYPPSIAIVWFNGSRWEDTEGFTKSPTHWMPLPSPPEVKS